MFFCTLYHLFSGCLRELGHGDLPRDLGSALVDDRKLSSALHADQQRIARKAELAPLWRHQYRTQCVGYRGDKLLTANVLALDNMSSW